MDTREEITPTPIGSTSIPCLAAADGVVVGTVHLQVLETDVLDGDADRIFSMADVHRAVDATHDQLESFQRRISSRIRESVADVFHTHLAILRDKELIGSIELGIQAQRPAVVVIREAYGHHIDRISRSTVLRLQEKAHDLQDIVNRLIRNLLGRGQNGGGLQGRIVVANVLFPSDLLRLVAQDAAGAILIGGGSTAHINLLAKSLQLPLVICASTVAEQLIEGMPILLDGGRGLLLTATDPTTLSSYGPATIQSADKPIALQPGTTTVDGHRIRLLVNVGLLGEAQQAHDLGADGIGLYRSEIPFLLRDAPPTEDEQVDIYRRLLDLAPGGDVAIRILDLGGDKITAYFANDIGANPSLGVRGIRFCFRHPDIFATQVRAMLRAGHGRNLRILIPMVSSVDCFRGVQDVISSCQAALLKSGVDHHPSPQLGAMIELPSAVLLAREIAREADFLALGTNDLVQYVLAVDRSDDRLSDWYIPWHPSVLRAIKMVADAAIATNRPLSVCGEIASDPLLMPVLIGMGITALSVPPRALIRVQGAITALRQDTAAILAGRVLACSTIAEVEDALGIHPANRRKREPGQYP